MAYRIVVGARCQGEEGTTCPCRLSLVEHHAHILCDSVCQVRSTGLVWGSGADGRTAGRAHAQPSRTLLCCWLDIAPLAYPDWAQACTVAVFAEGVNDVCLGGPYAATAASTSGR
jgi:hypothetical protein